MNEIIIALIAFSLFFIFMSVGYILKGRSLSGSCGGLGKIMGEDCDFCDNKDECETLKSHPNHLEN